jgi:DNA gyrase/topoisomerase IV subunit A
VKRDELKCKLLQDKLNDSKPVGCSKHCLENANELANKIVELEQIINDQNESLGLAVDQIETLKRKLEKCENGSPRLVPFESKRADKNRNSGRVT